MKITDEIILRKSKCENRKSCIWTMESLDGGIYQTWPTYLFFLETYIFKSPIDKIPILTLLCSLELCQSNSEARKEIQAGKVSINELKITDSKFILN